MMAQEPHKNSSEKKESDGAPRKFDGHAVPAKKTVQADACPELNSLFQAVELVAQAVVLKLREPPRQFTPWEKLGKSTVQFAKDMGPFITGVAGIFASIMVGVLTLTVTATIAYFTYRLNTKQAEVTQTGLKTSALADFTETDQGRRALAAIKLAAYGEDAYPAIKLALGVSHEGIRNGGAETAELMYSSRPDVRTNLMNEMLVSFQDLNPLLRLGVLEFYVRMAPRLTSEEKQIFLNQLKNRLGPQAQLCANESKDFVLEGVTFLGLSSLGDAKDLVLDIARNCPHGVTSTYEGARIHAVLLLPTVVKQQRLNGDARQGIITELRKLELDASDELKENIQTAVGEIEGIRDQ